MRTKEWRNADGKLHREDGPAVELYNGAKRWYLNGLLHREDGLAVEHSTYKGWYKYGKLHNVNGPAMEWTNGEKAWFLYGKDVTEKEHRLLVWEYLTQEQQDDIIFGKSDDS